MPVMRSGSAWKRSGADFQLAADLIGTSFSPSWGEIGHLSAIAAIRTFLSYFLDGEVENARKLQHPRDRAPLSEPA